MPRRPAQHLSPGRGSRRLNVDPVVAQAEKSRLEWQKYDELWEKIHNKVLCLGYYRQARTFAFELLIFVCFPTDPF